MEGTQLTPQEFDPQTVYIFLQSTERRALQRYINGRLRPHSIPEAIWVAWRMGTARVMSPRHLATMEDSYPGLLEVLKRAAVEPVI